MRWWIVVILLLGFWGCALKQSQKPALEITKNTIEYFQFGNKFFIKAKPGIFLDFKKAKKVSVSKEGYWVEPKGECISVIVKKNKEKKETSLCLKSVPPIKPHLKVLKIDSYAVDLQVISLFPEVGLFVWEKGMFPSFSNFQSILAGSYQLKNLSLGKTYFISGAVKFGENLYGPLSEPLKIEIKDTEPPLPPSGGGYFVKDDTITIIWDKSPSRDVVGYIVEREGKSFEVKKQVFKEKIFENEVIYKIKAIDRAGNESIPFCLKVKISRGG